MNPKMENSDRVTSLLVGRVVWQCCLGPSVVLDLMEKHKSVMLQIETTFDLTSNGERTVLSPRVNSANPSEISPVMLLYQSQVEAAYVHSDGTLIIDFTGSVRVTVPPDERYEAWQIADDDWKLLVVSMPGGELGGWDRSAP